MGVGSGEFWGGVYAVGAMQAASTKAIVGAIDEQTELLVQAQVMTIDRLDYLTDVMQWGFDGLLAGQDAMLAEQQGTNARLDRVIDMQVKQLQSAERLALLVENPVGTKVDEHLRAAAACLSKGWHEEAMVDIQRAIELRPTEGMAHFFAAVVHQHEENPDEALSEFLLAGKYLGEGEVAERAFIQAATINEAESDLGSALDCASKAVQARKTLNSRYLRARYGLAVNDSSGYEEELYSVLLRDVRYVPVAAADPLLKPLEETLKRVLERVRDERVRREAAALDAIAKSNAALAQTTDWATSLGIINPTERLGLPLEDARRTLAGNTIANTVTVEQQVAEMAGFIRRAAERVTSEARGWADEEVTSVRNRNAQRCDAEFASHERTTKILGVAALGGSPLVVVAAAIAGGILGYIGASALLPKDIGACLGLPGAILGAVVALVVTNNILSWLRERQAGRDVSGKTVLAKSRDKRVAEWTEATGEQVRQIETLKSEAESRIKNALAPLPV